MKWIGSIASYGMAMVLFTAASSPTAAAVIDQSDYSSLETIIKEITPPKISYPTWLKKQIAKEEAEAAERLAASNVAKRTISYNIVTRGTITSDVSEFKRLVSATLNDGRGWSRARLMFKEVKSGGSFTFVLAEASTLPSFSSGCSVEYSCRVGQYVIINQTRWQTATPSWNAAKGSLRDYRHMVVNHETGHWLGHGHQLCGGTGLPAPVMQQQSISLQGCTFNAWPLASELWIAV